MVQRLPDPDIGKMKKPRLVSAVCERVAKEVGEAAAQGALPLTLGGDHSLVSAAKPVAGILLGSLQLPGRPTSPGRNAGFCLVIGGAHLHGLLIRCTLSWKLWSAGLALTPTPQAMGTVLGTKSKYPDACLIWVGPSHSISL